MYYTGWGIIIEFESVITVGKHLNRLACVVLCSVTTGTTLSDVQEFTLMYDMYTCMYYTVVGSDRYT